MTEDQMQSAFNAAIDFAIDEADGEGILFLRMWREGDWDGIAKEFPDFDLSEIEQSQVQNG